MNIKATDAEDYSLISHHLVLGSVDLGESTRLGIDEEKFARTSYPSLVNTTVQDAGTESCGIS